MKKIIAVLLSIMLAFGVATSALAMADTTESTTTVESTTAVEMTTAKPEDPGLEEKDPAATPDEPVTEDSTDPISTTEAPLTTAPVIIEEETDISIPDTMDETPLDALYKAFLNLITVITEICYGITVDIYDIIFNLF
jgi:hypothetical protein